MNLLRNILVMIISMPKTLYFNFHYFEIKKAFKLPIFVSYKVKLKKMGDKGSIICPNKIMSIKFGFSDGSFSMGARKQSTFYHERGSSIEFAGKAVFCNQFYLTLKKNGRLHFGKMFQSNTNFILSCANEISFGDNCLIGWNVTVIDGDGHTIYNLNEDKPYNLPKKITIGNHTWISSNVIILKGSFINANSIVSSNALVCNYFNDEGIIIGGVPAKKIKSQIYWKEEWIE